MLVSLDYDGTYTRDPFLWDAVVKAFRSRGHKVFVITMRTPEQGLQILRDLKDKVDEIHFTCFEAKHDYATRNGINVNVWIDDMPFFIYMDAKERNDARNDGTARPPYE